MMEKIEIERAAPLPDIACALSLVHPDLFAFSLCAQCVVILLTFLALHKLPIAHCVMSP
jgi:hypothetical protein